MSNHEEIARTVGFRNASKHRFHLLDGLRGVVAMIVVLFHTPPALRPWLSSFDGWLAVDLFFCLSGFVIAYSYEKRLREGMKLTDFVVTRIIRLYPLYLLGLVIGVLSSISSLHNGRLSGVPRRDFVVTCVTGLFIVPYASGRWPIRYSFPLNVPSWSLFYELVANYLFALGLRLRIAKTTLLASIAIVCFSIWMTCARRSGIGLHVGYMFDSVGLGFARIGVSFAVGILVFRYFANQRAVGDSTKLLWPIGLLIATIGLLLWPFSVASSLWYQSGVIIGAFPLVVYWGARTVVPDRLIKACVFLGNLSFPLYIVHSPLLGLLTGRKVQSMILGHKVPTGLSTTGTILVLVLMAHVAAGRDECFRKMLSRLYNRSRSNRTAPGQMIVDSGMVVAEER